MLETILNLESSRQAREQKEKIKTLNAKSLKMFYKAKYNNYKRVSINAVVMCVAALALFWLADCLVVNRFALETLFSRLIMILFLPSYLYIVNSHNYKTNIVLSYVMLYAIGTCIILSTELMPNKEYVGEAFLILQIGYLILGLAVPKNWSQIWHFGIIIEVMLAKIVIPDMDLLMAMLYQCIIYVGIEYTIGVVEYTFLDSYSSTIKMEKLSIYDQLTNAYNRNKIDQLFVDDTDILQIGKTGVLMVDIDLFKQINDTYGHDAGDIVLQNLVKIIKSKIRKSDYVIRWGGEEFIILLPGCGENKAKQLAESIREFVELSGNNMYNVTVSIGLTIYNGGSFYDTVKEADLALYYAKEHGRNQVITNSFLNKS